MERAPIRGNPHGLGTFLRRAGLPSSLQPVRPPLRCDGWCPTPQDRQATFPLFSVELRAESSLQAGMAKCWQLDASLAHDGQASQVVPRRPTEHVYHRQPHNCPIRPKPFARCMEFGHFTQTQPIVPETARFEFLPVHPSRKQSGENKIEVGDQAWPGLGRSHCTIRHRQ